MWYKKLLFTLFILLTVTQTAHALPTTRSEQNVAPFEDGKFSNGTTTPSNLRWGDVVTNRLIVSTTTAGCAQLSASGLIYSTGTNCGSGSGGGGSNSKFATSSDNISVAPNGGGGIITTASSTFKLYSSTNGTTTNATSTNLNVSNALNVTSTLTANGNGLQIGRGTGTLSNGANNDVSISANVSYMTFTGPTGAYSVSGFANAKDGRILIANFNINQTLTISHDSGSASGQRITTPTQSDMTFKANGLVRAIFVYDQSVGAGVGYWVLYSVTDGNNVTVIPNGAIGLNQIATSTLSANQLIWFNNTTGLISGTGTQITLGNVIATSTTKSVFINASTTALDVSGYLNVNSASSSINNLRIVNGSSTALTVSGVASTSQLRIDTLANGCLNITSGLVGSTGVACGSGGGGGTTAKFSTSTNPDTAIFNNNPGNVGIGTSSPFVMLTISSSTASQLALTPGTATAALFLFRNSGNTLTISTSSPTTRGATTTQSNIFVLNQNGGLCIGLGCFPISVSGLYMRDQEGTGPGLYLAGNSGGDTDWAIKRVANNDSQPNDPLQIGTGNVPFGMAVNPSMTLDYFGNVGIGTTTPYALLSVASTTYNYRNPLFVVATSTGINGNIFNITATSSTLQMLGKVGNTQSQYDSGARIAVGRNDYNGLPIRDQLYVDGRINEGTWQTFHCYPAMMTQVITGEPASGPNACGDFNWSEGLNASLDVIRQNGIIYGRLGFVAPGSVNDGSMLYMGLLAGGSFDIASTTAVMETVARIENIESTTSSQRIGFMGTPPNSTTFADGERSGCYFVATSTNPNWMAQCTTGLSTTTVTTNFASSTVLTGTGDWYLFRIEAQNNKAEFFMGSNSTSTQSVATITTNIPSGSTQLVNPELLVVKSNLGAVPRLDFMGVRVWIRMIGALGF